MYRLLGRRGAGSLAPHMVLGELGVPYTFEHVEKDYMKSPEFLAINPMGTVPALILPEGRPMFESAAMLIHLTDAHPSPLAPRTGTPEHARFLQWVVFLSANLYETYLRWFYSDRYTAGGENEAGLVKQKAEADVYRHYGLAEQALDPFLLGKTPSAADLYLAMFVTWHDDPAALKRRYPKVGKMADAVFARPAIAKVLRENDM